MRVNEDPADRDPLPPVVEPAPWVEPSLRGDRQIADGIDCRLDPASVTASRLTGLVWVGAVGGPLCIGATAIALFASWPPVVKTLIFAGLLAVTALFGLWAVWWPTVSYRYTSYRTDLNGFTIRRGVLWRTVTSIPRARVQHTDVVQGPIQRRYGLGTQVIHTAGTQDASVSLSGLAYDRALPIRDFLIAGKDRHGA